jgi:hypothetical protein
LVLTVVAVIGALGVVLLSPLVIAKIPASQGIDWAELSNVGQTYGAASAFLAVLALAGVAVSLHLQRRESKAAREQALRALHTDLLRMSLDDEAFMQCWGPIGESTDLVWYRQHIFLNLVVSHWQMMWEIGALNEIHLRLTAAGIFGGPLGRRYWREARDARRVAEKGRRARSFYLIVDDEYQRNLPLSKDAIREQDGHTSHGATPSNAVPADPASLRAAWLIGGTAAAFAIIHLIRHRRRS